MMIDNDFPNALGFLQAYRRGMSDYRQEGESIPDFRLQNKYAQEFGGPLVEETVAQGIPVGEDPIFPMGQEEFSDYVRGLMENKRGVKGVTPESIKQRVPGAQARLGLV